MPCCGWAHKLPQKFLHSGIDDTRRLEMYVSYFPASVYHLKGMRARDILRETVKMEYVLAACSHLLAPLHEPFCYSRGQPQPFWKKQ